MQEDTPGKSSPDPSTAVGNWGHRPWDKAQPKSLDSGDAFWVRDWPVGLALFTHWQGPRDVDHHASRVNWSLPEEHSRSLDRACAHGATVACMASLVCQRGSSPVSEEACPGPTTDTVSQRQLVLQIPILVSQGPPTAHHQIWQRKPFAGHVRVAE